MNIVPPNAPAPLFIQTNTITNSAIDSVCGLCARILLAPLVFNCSPHPHMICTRCATAANILPTEETVVTCPFCVTPRRYQLQNKGVVVHISPPCGKGHIVANDDAYKTHVHNCVDCLRLERVVLSKEVKALETAYLKAYKKLESRSKLAQLQRNLLAMINILHFLSDETAYTSLPPEIAVQIFHPFQHNPEQQEQEQEQNNVPPAPVEQPQIRVELLETIQTLVADSM